MDPSLFNREYFRPNRRAEPFWVRVLKNLTALVAKRLVNSPYRVKLLQVYGTCKTHNDDNNKSSLSDFQVVSSDDLDPPRKRTG